MPVCVPTENVPQVWPHVAGMLKQVYERTDLGLFSELETQVFNGSALLWVVWKEPEILAALVTTIRITERSKSCMIAACGGSKREGWLHMMETIEAHAKAHGCNKIRAFGRKGWARVLKDFKTPFVVIEKDIA